MRSPGRRPARSAGEPALHDADHAGPVLYAGTDRALHQHDGQHDDREREVHRRSHDQNLEPLPLGLRQELVGLAGALVLGVLAGHLHVAAERDGAEAVFGVAAPDLQQLRTEAEREGQHAHAVPAGHQEMAELVHEHEHAEDERKREKRGHARCLSYDAIVTPCTPASGVHPVAQASTAPHLAPAFRRSGRVRVHRPRQSAARNGRKAQRAPRETPPPPLRWRRSARWAGSARPRARDRPGRGTESRPTPARRTRAAPIA